MFFLNTTAADIIWNYYFIEKISIDISYEAICKAHNSHEMLSHKKEVKMPSDTILHGALWVKWDLAFISQF